MATTFSFDIVSDFNDGEMNNAIDQARRELDTRYDFKGTKASIAFEGDKNGLIITGDSEYQLQTILDIIRKKLAGRGIDQKVLDTSKPPTTSNLKVTQEIVFKRGLAQDQAKQVTACIRQQFPKVKPQIQGNEIRVSSAKKDELQAVMELLRQTDFDFPLSFANYR